MIHWCLIIVLVSVPQISSVGDSTAFSLGEFYGKHYTIKQFNSPFTLDLITKEHDRISKNFNIPTCNQINATIHKTHAKVQENFLFLGIKNLEDNTQILLSVDLLSLFDNKYIWNCIDIADAYFGKHMIYTYRIEEEYTLKRWMMNPDGHEGDSVVVHKTSFPIMNVEVNRTGIELTILEEKVSTVIHIEDKSRCYTIKKKHLCEDDDDREKSNEIEKTFFEEHFQTLIIITSVLVILILLCIACCLCNQTLHLHSLSKPKYERIPKKRNNGNEYRRPVPKAPLSRPPSDPPHPTLRNKLV